MTDPSTTHDPRDDFDDDFGLVRTMPLIVKWAAGCWLAFALFNWILSLTLGYFLLRLMLENGFPWRHDHSGFVFLALLVVGFGALAISFGRFGYSAFTGKSASMSDILPWSWVVTGVVLVIWGCIMGAIFSFTGFRNLPLIEVGGTGCYVILVLAGSILATLGRTDYVRWKQKALPPVSSPPG